MPLPSPYAFDKYSWQLSHVVNLDNFAFLAQLYVFSDSHTVWIASQDVELCEVFYQFHHLKEISPWRTFCCVSIWTVFLLCWGTAVTIKTSFTITWEFLLTLVSMYFFLSFLFSSFLAYSFIFFIFWLSIQKRFHSGSKFLNWIVVNILFFLYLFFASIFFHYLFYFFNLFILIGG